MLSKIYFNMKVPNIDFYGLKLSSINKNNLIETVTQTIKQKQKIVIYGYSIGSIRLMRKLPIMYHFGNGKAEIMLVDGRGLYLLGKMLGFKFDVDISIPEFAMQLLNLANKNNYSLLLFGTTKEANLKATNILRENYKHINVYDGINGFYDIEQEAEIVKRINNLKPDILFLGISSPIKEAFVTRWKDHLDVRIILLCGGVIDILAGKKHQTPRFIKKIGLASLFRFIQEPVRLSHYFFPFLSFLFLNFLPVLFIKIIVLREKNFSIPKFYKLGDDTNNR